MADWIHLEGIKFPCKIGTSWAEHQREQPLEVSVHFGLDLSSAAAEDLSRTIDYGQALIQVETIARHGGWRLLETLGNVLLRWFLLDPAAGEARGSAVRVRVLIRKPEACAGRAIPAVEMERTRSENKVKQATLAAGIEQLIVGETEWVTVSRLDLQPNRSWLPPRGALVLQLPGAAQRAGGTQLRPQRPEAELTTGSEPVSWLLMHGSAVGQVNS